jgi:hypothetical protein
LYLVSVILGVLAMFIGQAGAVENYIVGFSVLSAGVIALLKLEFTRPRVVNSEPSREAISGG